MATYSRPGVFVNQSLTPLPSSGAGVTGGATACFASAYNIGPTQPTLVNSWQTYANLFGGFNVANGSPLAYAVYQYFLNGGSGCYVYRIPNTDAVVANLGVNNNPTSSSGIVPPGVYQVAVTYVNTQGETVASATTPVTLTAADSYITITSPAAQGNATGWYAYVSQAGGSTLTRQQAVGSPTAIGTNLVLDAAPTSSGVAPPVSNTSGLSAPAVPVPTTATTGGTVATGTYQVEVTYVNGAGETTASSSGSVTTTGSTSTITVPSPSASGNATGWYAYVTQAGGSTYTRQQAAGSPTAIGTNLTLTAPPTSGGASPPSSNTSGNPVQLQVASNYLQAGVVQQVQAALTALFQPPKVSFGQLITAGQIYQTIMAIPGVAWVVVPVITREDVTQTGTASIQLRGSEIPTPGHVFITANGGY